MKDADDTLDLKDLASDIKRTWNNSKKKRYKKFGKYVVDRWMGQGALFLILFWIWFIAQSYNYNLDYFKCGDENPWTGGPDQFCKNPFYNPSLSWRIYEYLPVGEYGTKPGPLFNSAWYVIIGILAGAGILNHIINNRRKMT